MQIFNNPIHKDRRQYLRRNMPEPELILWRRLKGRQFNGYKFRRQHGIGNYIVDFYCPSLSLVIEIDGESHFRKKAIQYDKNRSDYLGKINITEFRFTNLEIKSNIDGVMLKLGEVLTSSQPLLEKEGSQ